MSNGRHLIVREKVLLVMIGPYSSEWTTGKERL